ncbi:hypothetical protein KPL78_06240 [Roseomonas sp. HJA6]|uniref:DUF4148 domain-containing protein n=1 Tax=Roseomonas alba TaxID=2846776 RepID=A0ABS7A586_9PROT|nr:hypothetical protein [Neoroseomonas alba]MBW6397438.1 hypothetical protein [Neoroseomonas alba]
MATCQTFSLRRPAWMAGLAALALSGAVAAQGIPADEREPNPAAVGAAERADGDAPSAAEARRDARVTDQLYRELTGQNPNATPDMPPPGPMQSPAQDAREENQLYRELTGQNPNAAPPR